jgi:hypothetical protein
VFILFISRSAGFGNDIIGFGRPWCCLCESIVAIVHLFDDIAMACHVSRTTAWKMAGIRGPAKSGRVPRHEQKKMVEVTHRPHFLLAQTRSVLSCRSNRSLHWLCNNVFSLKRGSTLTILFHVGFPSVRLVLMQTLILEV